MKNDIPAGTTWRDLTVPWPVQQPPAVPNIGQYPAGLIGERSSLQDAVSRPAQPVVAPSRPTVRRHRRPPAQWWASLTAGTSGSVRLPVTQPQAVRRRRGREELAKRRRRREAMAKRRYVLRNRIRRLLREWGPGIVLVAIVLAVVATMVTGLAVELRWLAHQVGMLVAAGR